ncbi:N-acetyltransferase [Plantibacter sp. PA-3-X8]|uniref:GNAT family N-acetyltransferase n=1 Tax=Plantibacter sp. PA-3-X8 TaxID=2480625 RepID=UPI000F5F8CB8|nr:GNAT family protein [Plantibacter sp. PA-3-X8]AZH82516.1 N-acetyltransferase [Plantibacter sp. PA-3-X8]
MPSLSLRPIVRPSDDDAFVAFLSAHEFPFHVRRRPTAADARARLADGVIDGPAAAGFWVLADGETVGTVTLEDLEDDTALIDLRLASDARGRGIGSTALPAIVTEVFGRFPSVRKLEGQTREDNVAMRRAFRRAGWVKEAHYREGWPVDGGSPLASVAYAILRSDWESGTVTPVPWDDEP